MIRFRDAPSGPMRADYPKVHPELRALLEAFDAFSEAEGLPDPVVTDLVRSPEAQERIYVTFWQKLQQALEDGPHKGQIDPEGDGSFRPLTESEKRDAEAVRGLTLEQLSARAKNRFTWHHCACAADLRTRHYGPGQLKRVRAWVMEKTAPPSDVRPQDRLWEVLFHDVTAPHLHIARRDAAWRNLHVLKSV
jgi:hypothetical protein